MRQLTFPQGGQLSARFPSGGLGIPGTSDVARIRPAALSGSRARLCKDLIHNGESPLGPGVVREGARTGRALFGRHLMGGDRGLKSTRTFGTTRATEPFPHRDHAIGCALGHAADTGLAVKGVGVT